MRAVRLAALAVAMSPWMNGQFGLPPAPDEVLAGQFHTPLTAAQLLKNLDRYYQVQVGRGVDAVLPELARGVRYEVWRDMWVYFTAAGGQLTVTMKRPTEAGMQVLVKGWMLELAGRVADDAPIRFRDLPQVRNVQGQIYGARKELARVLADRPEFRLVPTWQHAGLMASARELERVTLAAAAGSHGAHRFTATAPTLEAARQLAALVMRIHDEACLCAVYSEAGEVEQDLNDQAAGRSADMTSTTAAGMVLLEVDPQRIEESLRMEPGNQKRLALARGWYGIKYRVEAPYRKVTLTWNALEGYVKGRGTYTSLRTMGQASAENVRPAGGGKLLDLRVRLESLAPGAYRLTLEGQPPWGEPVKVDQRDYWFDGTIFNEM